MKKDSYLHPRSLHHERYEFPPLFEANSALKKYVHTNVHGSETIDFFDPLAVKELNKALLLHHYHLQYWDIPNNYLCPPIPGRADYLHYLADLLDANRRKTDAISCLDIGTGANCIYPLIGASQYNWNFIGAELDEVAIAAAQKNIEGNPHISHKISLRQQHNSEHILKDIINKDDFFQFTLCNPPFHASAEEAAAGTQRKLKNLKYTEKKKQAKPQLNFGGQHNELWYPGGEIKFLENYINESKLFQNQVEWFTCLVSKETNIPKAKKLLKLVKAKSVKIMEMQQGQKKSRILAWKY